jgi:hypothetical protein
MSRLKKSLLIIAGLLIVTVLFIMLALPNIIRSKAAEAVKKSYNRTLAIRKVSINPFTWTVEARGISLSEKGNSAVFFTCTSVRAAISPRSVRYLAPVVSSVDIVAPYVHIVRLNATTYNFSDFIPKEKAKKDEKPARFSLNNIWLKQGTIDFTDQLLPEEQQHAVRKLEVRVPFISNLPYLANTYITPGISAITNGSPFSLEGKIKPFSKHVEVLLEVKLKELDLPFYASYIPATIPIRLDSGTMNTNLQITYRAVATGEPALIVTGQARIDDLELTDRQEQPLLTLDEGSIKIGKAQILAGIYDIDAVELTGPEIHLSRDRQGILNVARLAASAEKKDEAPRPVQEKLKSVLNEGMKQRKTETIVVNVAKIGLEGGQVHIRDELPPGGFAVDLDAITLDVTGFSNQRDKNAPYTLSFATNRKEQFNLSGTFSALPVTTATKATFSGVVLEAAYPYLSGILTAPVSGRLAGSADITFNPDAGPQITHLGLALKNLAVRFGEKDGVRIPEITVKGGAAGLKERRATVESVAVKGGSIIVSRAPDGKLSPMTLLRPPDTATSPKPATTTPHPATMKPPESPFRYAVNTITVTGLDLGFTDYQKKASPSFALKKTSLTLANLTGPGRATVPFKFSAGFDNGSLASTGTLGIEPLRFNGTGILKGIPINAFSDYFPEDLHLIIADGLLDTDLKISLAMAKDVLDGNVQGSVTVKRFHSLDDIAGDDLLKWESLQLDGIQGVLNPFSLNIAQVSLTDYFAKVTIEKDATLNLQKIYGAQKRPVPAGQAPGPTTPVTSVQPATSPSAPAAPAAQPRKVAIEAVTLQGGTLVFADHHIKPEFSATMYKLGGKISGLSSEQMKFADVDLRGNLRNQSPLSITGKINPLRGDLFVDMKVSFNDIELSPLTPYTGEYLGYAVDKGKLFLDLIYHIENKQLTSQNKVFIDQFIFGDKVESDKATKLPVRLAIALLKDSKGEIHLDLPVTGRTDDPKFSVWRVIGQILMNLLEKAATAPFKLLGSLFGGTENFSSVTFTPGSSNLSATEARKLTKLGKVLTDRPALTLEVTGFVDKERDPEGFRQELLLKKLRNEKFLALVKEKKNLPGQTADTLEIGPEEYSRWLTTVYKKEKFPKPRNAIGFAKDLPDAEMKKLIFATTTVGPEEFALLARERAVTVKNYLVSEAKVPRERVFEKSGDIFESPKDAGTPVGRVEFGLAVK